MVNRTFLRLEEGLVHYRFNLAEQSARSPVLMMHPSPASSIALEPLIAALGNERSLYAPDTLGCGDSAAPASKTPDLQYYAESMHRFLDALNIDRCHIYGSHTGAHIGIELALLIPDRIKTLTLDGVAVLSADQQQDFLANYAPPFKIDAHGGQFMQVWQYVRDQMVFFPHFKKDDEHRRLGGDFSAQRLHSISMDLLKNLNHYHKTYHAVFRHPVLERMARIKTRVMLLTSAHDPLAASVTSLMECKPDTRLHELSSESDTAKAAAVNELMDEFE